MTSINGVRHVRLQSALLHLHPGTSSFLVAGPTHTPSNLPSSRTRQSTRLLHQTCIREKRAPNPNRHLKHHLKETGGLQGQHGWTKLQSPVNPKTWHNLTTIPDKENSLDYRDPMNPPASTRAPPLDLPKREEGASAVGHLYNTGKAYMKFYKTAIKAVWTNRGLVKLEAYDAKSYETMTRAAFHVQERVKKDRRKLVPFVAMLLICGEFTPLVVMMFPRIAPATCMIPSQKEKIRQLAAARRTQALNNVDRSALHDLLMHQSKTESVADSHICRLLNIGSSFWDRFNISPPFMQTRVKHAIVRLAIDDRLIREGGGVEKMVDEEVVLACEDRGLDVLGKDIAELRDDLDDWLITNEPPRADGERAMDQHAEGTIRKHLLTLMPVGVEHPYESKDGGVVEEASEPEREIGRTDDGISKDTR